MFLESLQGDDFVGVQAFRVVGPKVFCLRRRRRVDRDAELGPKRWRQHSGCRGEERLPVS
jgi:hypothetical protein